jgi:hypothetical protein
MLKYTQNITISMCKLTFYELIYREDGEGHEEGRAVGVDE